MFNLLTHSKPMVYDKASVETTALGECNLSIRNGYTLWGEEGRVDRLSESITNSIHLAKEIGLGGCAILRLAIVTGTFSSEVMEWTKQLGET